MLMVAIAWAYVVVMMAAAEATSSNGTLLGAFFTLLFYGVLPLSIVLYLLGTRSRRARRDAQVSAARPNPDNGGHAAGDAVAPVREEP